MSQKSQNERVLKYMKTHAAIDANRARKTLGVSRLAARIYDLRKEGHVILDHTKSVLNRWGEAATVKEYWLVEEKIEAA